MRKFLVGACCVIVGLQFVAAVVVVIGLAVLAAVGGVRVPTVVQYGRPGYYPDSPTYSDSSTRVSPTVQSVAWDAPAAAVPATASDRAAPDPRIETILEYREQVGSSLAGTILEGDPTSPEALHEISSILAEVSAQAPDAAPANFAAPLSATVPAEHATCPDQPPSPLAEAVEHLYHQAGRHESRGEYERADQLRELVRRLRREMEFGGDTSGPEIQPVPMLPDPVAPENPAELPATEPRGAESVIPPS
jgi:hypothetical protein